MRQETIDTKVQQLLHTDFSGIITGTALVAKEARVPVDAWMDEPDIDIFAYTPASFQHIVSTLLAKGYDLGKKGADARNRRRNAIKFNRCMHTIKQDMFLNTIEISDDDVTYNITYKKDKHDGLAVLASYDTTCIMYGIDIETANIMDLRLMFSDSIHTAKPNPIRWAYILEDASTWKASMMLRQWSRVLKLWQRGFDTRPLARAYKTMLEHLFDIGCAFDTDDSIERYEIFDALCRPFLEEHINPWLEAHDDV